jgi:L-amino acid N-acyltransferase YncA
MEGVVAIKGCRRLVRADLSAVTALYNAGIAAGEMTRDVRPQTEEQIAPWLLGEDSSFESYVVEGRAGLVAWASLTKHHEREAYRPTAELTVYVTPSARGGGLGLTLGQATIGRAPSLSFHSLVALLVADQPPALRLAARLGFSRLGSLSGAYPCGEDWIDVTLWQRRLDLAQGAGT